MEKRILTGILSAVTALPLVSAQNLPAPPIALNGLFDMFNGLLNNASMSNYSDLIARLLIFVLLAVILYRPATMIVGGEGKEKIGALISSIIAIMAIRFMDAEMVRGLFLPYQAMGVVLSILIPFILFEFFMIGLGEKFPKTFKTVGYVMMAGIFTGMWFFRFNELGDIAYYYLGATVLCLIALSLDETFRQWRVANRIGSAKKRAAYYSVIGLEEDLKKAVEAYGAYQAGTPGEKMARAEIQRIEHALKKLNSI